MAFPEALSQSAPQLEAAPQPCLALLSYLDRESKGSWRITRRFPKIGVITPIAGCFTMENP